MEKRIWNTVDAVLITMMVIMIAYCSGGCAATSTITRRTPAGDVTMRSESYAGGLVTSYNEDVESDGDYARCIADRRSQRTAGGAWIWSDDQMTCYWQTASGAPTGTGMGMGMGMGMGGGFGYAWGAPALTITPGVR